MSYTPNEWKKGDVVTSEKLNHMEQGIAESGGDSYDLEILCNKTPTSASDISDFEIISGSIETIEEKITNGEFSKAIVYFLAHPTPSTSVFRRCELILFDIGYRLMEFAYKDGVQLLIYYTSDYELSSFSFSAG